MADALAIDLADAVVTALNGATAGTFDLTFTAARAFLVENTPEELTTLKVSVVPADFAWERASRAAAQEDHGVYVAVQKFVATTAAATLDPLMRLVEAIRDYLRNKALSGVNVACVAISNDPVFDAEHLRQLHVFTSVIRLTYRTVR